MSTSRSALQLLRDEPTLVGAVLHLVACGALATASDPRGIPLRLFERFSGVPMSELLQAGRGMVALHYFCHDGGSEWFVSAHELAEWLEKLASDRSDFAPAVPRALPGGRVS